MIARLFLESPALWCGVWIPLQVVLLLVWSAKRSQTTARLVWTGFALLVAVLALQVVVVTPREQVIRLCRQMARLAEEGDIRAIRSHLGEDFEAADLDRARFMDRVERSLGTYDLDSARVSDFEISFPAAREAIAVLTASGHVDVREYPGRVVVRFRITFRGLNGRWEITGLEVVPAPFSPFVSLPDLLR